MTDPRIAAIRASDIAGRNVAAGITTTTRGADMKTTTTRQTKRDQRLQYLREAIKEAAVNLRIAGQLAETIARDEADDFTTRGLLDQATGIFHDAARIAQLAAELHAETLAGN